MYPLKTKYIFTDGLRIHNNKATIGCRHSCAQHMLNAILNNPDTLHNITTIVASGRPTSPTLTCP